MSTSQVHSILSADALMAYVAAFNRDDQELYRQHIPNDRAAAWMSDHIPLFECPDKEIEEIYYFRWWTFRKHLKETPDGFVITEFLPPVPWAGKHNTISCAAAHHFREGRWLRDNRYLDDYARFWLRGGGEMRTHIETNRGYSFWIADSLLSQARVSGRFDLCLDLLPDLIANYEGWEREQRDSNGLFWQRDDRDGMEYSISGKLAPNELGYRATINSYMYGDALAIAEIAGHAGDTACAERFRGKAAEIKRLTQELLWDPEVRFFKVLPRVENPTLSDARELHGYTPWYFNLPDADKSDAWAQLMDPKGFYAPFGPTTAEQRHPEFAVIYMWKCCQWNGPSWPFATSVTLTALANLLNDYTQHILTFFNDTATTEIYTRSHRLRLDDGREVPWIDESLHPLTGDWLTRTAKKYAIGRPEPGWSDGAADPAKLEERGKDYNHSTYCDLIINGLVGLRPQSGDRLVVSPLIPEDWDYFCLDRVRYHGRDLTVLYDRTGEKYGRGKGLRLLCDGRELAVADALSRIAVGDSLRPKTEVCESRVAGPNVVVDAAFPGGNIIVDEVCGARIRIRQDLRDTEGDWFYWYFRVRGAAGRTLDVEFSDSQVIGNAGPAASFDGGATWQWLGLERVRDLRAFACDVPAGCDEARFALAIPYVESNLRAWLTSHADNPHLRLETLCRSRAGRAVERLRLGCVDRDPEHRILLSARHHCCEMTANFVLEGVMDTMLGDGETGRWFRDRVEACVVPFADKDGVEQGDQGKNRRPRDHARDYLGESIYPETHAVRQFVPRWSDGRLRLVTDIHCPWIRGRHNEQIYQVGAADPVHAGEQARFGRILEDVRRGELPYRAEDDLPFGVDWNTAANYATGTTLARWASGLPDVALTTSFEIPYAVAGGVLVTPERARAFGRDLAEAIRDYLTDVAGRGASENQSREEIHA
jgi:hypothetical protein